MLPGERMLSRTPVTIASGATLRGTVNIEGTLLVNGQPLSSLPSAESGSAMSVSRLIVENTLYVMGPLTIDGLARFLGDAEFAGNVLIGGVLTLDAKQAGTVMIPAGMTGATVTYEQPFATDPIVTATPIGIPSAFWGIISRSATGFTIGLAQPATTDIAFTWLAIPTADASEETPDDLPVVASGASISSASSSSSESAASEQATETASAGIPFPLGADDYPISSSTVWNNCIRNVPTFDETGQPLTCARYHSDNEWDHPDLGIRFTWRDDLTPFYLKLPEGYAVTTVSAETSTSAETPTEETANGAADTENETQSSSAASSEHIADTPVSSDASAESPATTEPESNADETANGTEGSVVPEEPTIEQPSAGE